jgi:hypothetical protein
MMTKEVRKIAIVMDEIDGMNNGDKGGITALIKLIRQKKTKKQRMENMTMNPIICIGNYYMDKKMRELMKVCNVFELNTPTNSQINNLITKLMPNIKSNQKSLKENIIKYIQGDLRKLNFVNDIYKKTPQLLNNEIIKNIFQMKSYNEDSKKITQELIEKPMKIEEHNKFMNETDRTIVALLWHENIVDALSSNSQEISYPFYLKILNNICYSDYIDRITFQNQIWQFNEMSSLMKTFHNNKLYHDYFPDNKKKSSFKSPSTPSLNENTLITNKLLKCLVLNNNLINSYALYMDINEYDDLFITPEIEILKNAEYIITENDIVQNKDVNQKHIQKYKQDFYKNIYDFFKDNGVTSVPPFNPNKDFYEITWTNQININVLQKYIDSYGGCSLYYEQ